MVFKQISSDRQLICPLCEFSFNELRLLQAGVSVFQCPQCELAFKDPANYLDIASEKRHYLNHNNTVEDQRYLDYLRLSISAVQSEIKYGDLILDYGCGPVKGIEHLLKDYRVFSYDPIFFTDDSFMRQKFNCIFVNEVAEHFFRPDVEFEKLNSLLKDDGVMVVRTELFQNKQDWFYAKDPTHVVFYSLKTLEYLCQRFGFELTKFSDKIFVLKSGA